MRKADRTRRVARIVALLSGHRRGATIGQIVTATGASRATVYRDLELLRDSGYELEVATVNAEARYHIVASALASEPMTAKQRAALAVARRALGSLEGSWVVRELDAIVGRAHAAPHGSGVLFGIARPAFDPEVLRTVHEAVTQLRKLRLRYRGVKDAAPRDRTVHPIAVQVVDQQPYLIAWDEQRRDRRSFKVARISSAKLLRERARPDVRQSTHRSRASAVKVWSSDPVDVRIRIGRQLARFVHEWPLVPEQAIEVAEAGAVDVCACVFGLEETLRWVLRWGSGAEVIEPKALRNRVHEELATALNAYERRLSHGSETAPSPPG